MTEILLDGIIQVHCVMCIAYHTDAFQEYIDNGGSIDTIDTDFVDGVVLTHGSPRKHIWTFAAGYNQYIQYGTLSSRCPCNDDSYSYTLLPFVGNDYFCDSGQWRSQGGGKRGNCPLFFKENALGVEQSVTS